MKQTLTCIALILIAAVTYGQGKLKPKPKLQPLILRGQLKNSPEKLLKIGFTDENGIRMVDTIRLDDEGKFYLKTYKIKNPQVTGIVQKTTQINGLFLAPGYDLTITGDATDFKTLFKTTRIEGLGAESNQYRTMRNAILAQRMGDKPWYDMNEADLIAYAQKQRRESDSLLHAAFDPYLTKQKSNKGDRSAIAGTPKDPYLSYFKNMVQLNNQFIQLYYMLTLANQKKYDYAAAQALIENHTDPKLLANMSKDSYLASDDYKNWVAGGEYTDYQIKLDYLRDSTLKKVKGYRLVKMDQIYTGKVKDFVLFQQMNADITFAKSFDRLNRIKDMFAPYIAKLQNKVYQKTLTDGFKAKEAELLSTSVGKPAPAFTLQSNAGTTHSLADYKGKVVLIDLWASWCGPCREQTPHLAKLYDKYKSDDRLSIISIAVSDGKKEWLHALEADKPAWLQLVDKEDQVNKGYVSNMIPQFIIVDKKGNIANFNAPGPSTGKELEDMLLAEMVK